VRVAEGPSAGRKERGGVGGGPPVLPRGEGVSERGYPLLLVCNQYWLTSQRGRTMREEEVEVNECAAICETKACCENPEWEAVWQARFAHSTALEGDCDRLVFEPAKEER
jgi:hypothetical protein